MFKWIKSKIDSHLTSVAISELELTLNKLDSIGMADFLMRVHEVRLTLSGGSLRNNSGFLFPNCLSAEERLNFAKNIRALILQQADFWNTTIKTQSKMGLSKSTLSAFRGMEIYERASMIMWEVTFLGLATKKVKLREIWQKVNSGNDHLEAAYENRLNSKSLDDDKIDLLGDFDFYKRETAKFPEID